MQDDKQKKQFISDKEKRRPLLIWLRLARFYNQSIRMTNSHLKKWRLTMAQFDALNQIGLHQPMTQQQLGEKLEVTKGNITQLLKRMEVASLIEREQVWKTKYIALTKEGQALYEEVVPVQEQFQIEQIESLDSDEQEQLLQLLKKLQKSVEKEGENACN